MSAAVLDEALAFHCARDGGASRSRFRANKKSHQRRGRGGENSVWCGGTGYQKFPDAGLPLSDLAEAIPGWEARLLQHLVRGARSNPV